MACALVWRVVGNGVGDTGVGTVVPCGFVTGGVWLVALCRVVPGGLCTSLGAMLGVPRVRGHGPRVKCPGFALDLAVGFDFFFLFC